MSEDLIGFIGLGLMGGAIARRMLRSGKRLLAFDINPSALERLVGEGASPARSVREVADHAGLILICLPTGGSTEVAEEASQGQALTVYAELSTMRPRTMGTIAKIMAERHIAVVDAPVSGGVTIAERGELSLMMAGEREPMDRLAGAMSGVTGHVFRIGNTPGQAQLCKLVNNAIGFTLFIASCEALVTGVAGGVEPEVLLQAVNAGTGRTSWSADKFGPHVLSRTFDAGGKLGGGPRALDLYLAEAEAVGMPAGLVQRAREVWAKIAEVLDPTKDFTTMIRYFEKFAGVELKSPSVSPS